MNDDLDDDITDGRLLKGKRRRALVLEAAMHVVVENGLTAVSQRSVARRAGLPPSAVTYYFPTIDELLTAALSACNDACLRQLDDCSNGSDPLADLASLITGGAGVDRVSAAAEYELLLMAARRADLQAEAARWMAAIDDFFVPYVADPVRRSAVAAAVDGLFMRCFCVPDPPTRDEVLAMLRALVSR